MPAGPLSLDPACQSWGGRPRRPAAIGLPSSVCSVLARTTGSHHPPNDSETFEPAAGLNRGRASLDRRGTVRRREDQRLRHWAAGACPEWFAAHEEWLHVAQAVGDVGGGGGALRRRRV